ncbi:MAG TPA: YkgJ family cysteine cluster protein [Polyangia bacterium]|nr:YkgJ family cysteine cluster protein [Polyangia bacterium]
MSTSGSNATTPEVFTPVSGARGARSPLATKTIQAIWTAAAERLGLTVARSRDAYASSDGRGVLAIGADDLLDADDAVAQLIFHELCHAITEGDAALSLPDWGLENRPEHKLREHACLRFAAELADRFGLRSAMAPTTEYRAYYDALPADPLEESDDEAAAIARGVRDRFQHSTWRAAIEDALAQTASLVRLEGAHPAGFAWGPAGETCGGCAWMYRGGRGPAVARCRHTAAAVGDGARVDPATRACARWEPPVDCQDCGACCREAYHSVTVSVRDPVVWQEPALIQRQGHRFEIRREGVRCAALTVAEAGTPRYACSIYEHRPKPCREFEANGRHCLDARRRVGLSAGRA